jgi:AraC family transcriptional regulator
MDELEVRIGHLPSRRVASVHGFGSQPEPLAWEKLVAWAGPRGLLADPEGHRIYGFNNPNPTPASPNYGYEFWIDVDAGTPLGPDGDATVKDVEGGLYAVARFHGPGEEMPSVWHRLLMWGENSAYRLATHQWLEKFVSWSGDLLELDLMLPIAE